MTGTRDAEAGVAGHGPFAAGSPRGTGPMTGTPTTPRGPGAVAGTPLAREEFMNWVWLVDLPRWARALTYGPGRGRLLATCFDDAQEAGPGAPPPAVGDFDAIELAGPTGGPDVGRDAWRASLADAWSRLSPGGTAIFVISNARWIRRIGRAPPLALSPRAVRRLTSEAGFRRTECYYVVASHGSAHSVPLHAAAACGGRGPTA